MKKSTERIMVTIVKSTAVNWFTKKNVELFNYAYMTAKDVKGKKVYDCQVIDRFLTKEEVDLFNSKELTKTWDECAKVKGYEFPWLSPKLFFSEIWNPVTPVYGIRLSNMAAERIV